ncbi:MAG: flagellar motor switch protein FliN/FliY [Parvibaculaceae bacterium]|nr:FliM/FliN family flagellar motor switch protein [Parvibaculaceae bacterium]
MNSVGKVNVELSVVLGRASMPIHQLLKMGRGAVIELDAHQDEEIWILANNIPIARGEIMVQGEKIAVSITHKIKTYETMN